MKSVTRRQFIKTAATLAGVSVGTALLNACSGTPTAAPSAPGATTSAPTAAPAAKGTVRWATWYSGGAVAQIDQMCKDFTAIEPSITVVHEPSPGGMPFHEKMMSAMVAGDPPDIFRMWGGTLAKPFIVSGHVLPLDDEYKAFGWDDVVIPWAKQACARDGKTWGLPTAARGMWPTYRKDLFDKVGIKVPGSLEEAEANNEKLLAAGISPVTLGGKNAFYHFMRWIDLFFETKAGPKGHDELKALNVSWDTPEVVEAFATLRKWVDKKWFIADFMGVEPTDARMPLYQGKAAMILENDAIETTMANDGQDTSVYDFFPFPTGHSPLRVSGYPEMFLVWKGTKVKDAAIKFMNWFVQPDQQSKYYGALGATATVGVTPPDPTKWALTVRNREFMDKLEAVFPPADQALETELMGMFSDVQVKVISGQLSPEQAAKEMQSAIETWKSKQAS